MAAEFCTATSPIDLFSGNKNYSNNVAKVSVGFLRSLLSSFDQIPVTESKTDQRTPKYDDHVQPIKVVTWYEDFAQKGYQNSKKQVS